MALELLKGYHRRTSVDGSRRRKRKEIVMRSALNWFVLGIHMAIGIVMLFFGIFFLRNACLSLWMADGLAAFLSLLFGVTLHIVGGGVLFSIAARFGKVAATRRYS
jgi:hypothetical protein